MGERKRRLFAKKYQSEYKKSNGGAAVEATAE
jgi:hypothetical protein